MRTRKSKPVETPYEMTEDEARIVAHLEEQAKAFDALADRMTHEATSLRLATMASGVIKCVAAIRRGEHRR